MTDPASPQNEHIATLSHPREDQDSGDPSAEANRVGPAEGDAAVNHWRNIPRRTMRIALTVLPIVALINVGVLVWSLDGIDLRERIVAPHLLGLVALLVFVPTIGNSVRLALWSRFLGNELGFLRSLKVITGTTVTNSVTPSATGGAPIKILFLMGEGVESRRALTLVSFQVAEDTLATFMIIGMCLAVTGYTIFDSVGGGPQVFDTITQAAKSVGQIAFWGVVGFTALAFVIAGGLLGGRLRRWFGWASGKVRSFFGQIGEHWALAFKRGKLIAVASLALALLQWGIRFSIAGLVLAAFGVEWQPAVFWLLQYLVQSISSLVPTPGGAGGAEAGFLLLYQPFASLDTLVPAMSTWRLMFFYLPLGAAALVFFLLHRRGRSLKAKSDKGSSGSVPAPAE
ncbi:MAG: flippase-like domain-containing protein [Pseudomonadota bacterium]